MLYRSVPHFAEGALESQAPEFNFWSLGKGPKCYFDMFFCMLRIEDDANTSPPTQQMEKTLTFELGSGLGLVSLS